MPTLPTTKKKASDAPPSADDGRSHLKASEATAEKPQQMIEAKEEYLVTEGVRRVKAASEAVSVPLSHIASTHIARSKPRNTKTKSKKKQKQSRGAPGGPSIPSAVDLLPDVSPYSTRCHGCLLTPHCRTNPVTIVPSRPSMFLVYPLPSWSYQASQSHRPRSEDKWSRLLQPTCPAPRRSSLSSAFRRNTAEVHGSGRSKLIPSLQLSAWQH